MLWGVSDADWARLRRVVAEVHPEAVSDGREEEGGEGVRLRDGGGGDHGGARRDPGSPPAGPPPARVARLAARLRSHGFQVWARREAAPPGAWYLLAMRENW